MIDPALQRRRMIRLLMVLVVIALLTGGIYGLYILNRPKPKTLSDEERIALAQSAFSEQSYDRVIELLEAPSSTDKTISAIQNDAALLRIYISAREAIPLSSQRHLSNIVPPLTQVLRLDPDDKDSQHRLVETLLTLKRYDEAQSRARELSRQNPDDAHLLRQLAEAQLQKSQTTEAITTLQQAMQIDPLHVATFTQMVELTMEYEQPIEPMLQFAQDLYRDHRQDVRAMMIRALAHEVEGNGVQARALLKQASTTPPQDPGIVPTLTQWLDRSGMYAEATQYLLTYAPDGLDTPSARMAIYRAFEAGNTEQLLSRLSQSNPEQANSDLLGMWASACLKAGELEQAKSLIKNLEHRDSLIAKTWVTLLKIDQQDHSTPAEVIDAIVSLLETPNNPEVKALARRHPFFMTRLGDAYLQAYEPEAAYAAYLVATTNSTSWALPRLSLSKTLLLLDQPTAAMVQAREAQVRDNTDETRSQLVLAMARAAEPNLPDSVDRVLSEAEKMSPGSTDAHRVVPALVDLLIRAKRQEEAGQRISALLEDPAARSAEVLESLLRLSIDYQLGLDAPIAQAIRSIADHEPGLALIQALSIADPEEAHKYFLSAAPDPITRPWQTALAQLLVQKQTPDATDYLIQIADQYPNDIELQLAALQASNPKEHSAFFNRAIERLRQVAGFATIHWRLQQARMSMQDVEDKRAIENTIDILTEAESYTPVHLELRLALSQCYLMLNRYQEAADRAQAAKSIAPRHPRAMLLNATALHRLNQHQQARLDLIPLINDSLVDPDTRFKACLLLHEQGESEAIRQPLEQMWAADQANSQMLILLAQSYLKSGLFDQVDQICRALMNKPDAASIRFVTSYYRQSNRSALAKEAIDAAGPAGIDQADIKMIKAEDAAHRGDVTTAISLIEEAARLQPDHLDRWYDAVQLALATRQPEDAIRIAQVALQTHPENAGLMSLTRNASLIKQIQNDPALIPLCVAMVTNNYQREYVLSALKINQSVTDPKEAALALANLAHSRPDFKHLAELAADRLLKADLNDRAYELAMSAMARFPDSAASARVASLSAYRLQEWGMLLTNATAWLERNPQDRANADLMRAAAMNKLDRYPASVRTLKPYINAHSTIAADNQLLFELYTHALVKSGDPSQAWSLLSPHLATSSQARSITLKRVAEDLPDPNSAMDWLNSLTSLELDQTELFNLATASFTAGNRLGDLSLLRFAQSTLDKLFESPGPHSIDMHYARGYIAQRLGNLDQALASYRLVESQAPDNAQVLNNIALVLADKGGESLTEADQYATRATQLLPDDANLIDTLAVVQLRRGHLEEALKTIDKAIQLDPTSANWQLTKADILEAMGEKPRADQLRERYRPRVQN